MKKIVTIILCITCSQCFGQHVDYDKKLKELGIQLMEPSKPAANYVKAVRTGNLLFLSGHGPNKPDGSNITGKVGKELTVEEGYNAAKQTGISLLSTLKAELGDLNKVKRVVKSAGNGELPFRLYGSTKGDQWLFRFDGVFVW